MTVCVLLHRLSYSAVHGRVPVEELTPGTGQRPMPAATDYRAARPPAGIRRPGARGAAAVGPRRTRTRRRLLTLEFESPVVGLMPGFWYGGEGRASRRLARHDAGRGGCCQLVERARGKYPSFQAITATLGLQYLSGAVPRLALALALALPCLCLLPTCTTKPARLHYDRDTDGMRRVRALVPRALLCCSPNFGVLASWGSFCLFFVSPRQGVYVDWLVGGSVGLLHGDKNKTREQLRGGSCRQAAKEGGFVG